MNPTVLSTVAQLSNSDLLSQVKLLAGREREVTAILIAHLAELDVRRLYLAEGCASLFTYCIQILHLSEHAAYDRIQAARASRKLPVILEMLSDGSVNLSTVCLLAPHLTPENHRELLDAARHKTKRQVEELVARLRPQPPVPDVIRRLPTRASPAPGSLPDGDAQPLLAATPPAAAIAPPPAHRAVITPLAPQRYKVQFTASAELHEKIWQAQALLRHQIPDGDLSKVFDRALTALLQDLARKKLATTERPRASRGNARGSRHIPAQVKRAVWSRDGGRCAFVADNGRRCTEEAFLELHHVLPHAVGGPATVENIELRCRAHNGYEAERDFGR
ncbi:MAG: HNH endonuclease, partial [bacterium]